MALSRPNPGPEPDHFQPPAQTQHTKSTLVSIHPLHFPGEFEESRRRLRRRYSGPLSAPAVGVQWRGLSRSVIAPLVPLTPVS